MTRWPKPTVVPDTEDMEDMMYDSVCAATDGCIVEPDGTCEHGYPSWLLYWNLI